MSDLLPRPMLAATFGLDPKKHVLKLEFPQMMSAKIDGIRARVIGGQVWSRANKLIPCPTAQFVYGRAEFDGFDGELTLGQPNDPNCLQRSMRLMSPEPLSDTEAWMFDGTGMVPALAFHVFDYSTGLTADWAYKSRFAALETLVARWRSVSPGGEWLHLLRLVPHEWALGQADVEAYLQKAVDYGWEGIMLNDPEARYKHGRSGKKRPELTKYKRFATSEAVVIDALEMEHNDNAAKTSELGLTKRSSKKEGKRAAGVLGSLVCETVGDPDWPRAGVQFNIGAGFSAAQKEEFWALHAEGKLVGRVLSFKHFAETGVVSKPRQPVFVGWRDD